MEEETIPGESELFWREAADAFAIEGVDDEHHDRQIEKREDEKRVDGEQRRARGVFGSGGSSVRPPFFPGVR